MSAQDVRFPPGCDGPTFPDAQLCLDRNWDLGPDAKDECAPEGPYPIAGEQVYIDDPFNFCIALPNPDSPTLKELYYSKGLKPSIVQAEGYVRAFCAGDYMSPGALPLPEGAIRSAHVVRSVEGGKAYSEIFGTMDCVRLGINCVSSVPGAFDDGGQYDAVSYRNCGKSPYSGVDKVKHPDYVDYVEQAGNGLFCMRVCVAGQQLTDPCNVKNDTVGCQSTFGIVFRDGFSLDDKNTGEQKVFTVDLPPLATATDGSTSAGPKSTDKATTGSGAASTTIMSSLIVACLFTLLFC
jgi:hypothetical protein